MTELTYGHENALRLMTGGRGGIDKAGANALVFYGPELITCGWRALFVGGKEGGSVARRNYKMSIVKTVNE